MWSVTAQNIYMVEGDFGIILPIKIEGITLTASDSIKVTIKKERNGNALIEKVFTNITQNTVNLELTEEESNSLHTGLYVYTIDWYQNNVFMCNLIEQAYFGVVDKA